jgi:peptidoglycan/LPS O-acetylase OafA/YrhL
MKKIIQLDALRGIAIILVLIQHWLPEKNSINKIPNGALGVETFFVLSGFLITRILFENRVLSGEILKQKWLILKNFYLRRVLRIFPIYYLAIIVLVVFQKYAMADIHAALIYLLTYTQNQYIFKIQHWPGILSPFWTLAAEEQFYLVWPFIMLFTRRKYLPHVIILSILIGLSAQIIFRNVPFVSILTITCFDAFGAGALLAWVLTYKPALSTIFFKWLGPIAIISLIVFIVQIIHPMSFDQYIPIRILIAAMALWVITYIVLNQDKKVRFGFILNNRVLIFIGGISYGIYLYHDLVVQFLNYGLVNVYINPYLPDLLTKKYFGLLFLLENTCLTLLVAWLSYIYIELPILRLKNKFEYRKP